MKKILRLWLKQALWKKIIVALIGGVIAGALLGKHAVFLKPIGNIFINAIHMMVVPVVFTAIVCAILSAKDSVKMGAVWYRAIILYFISMIISVLIGIAVSILLKPGLGIDIHSMHLAATTSQAHQAPSFAQALINIVPANPIAAFASENVLQILIFALILGFSINMSGEYGKPVEKFFRSLSAVVFNFARIIMGFAPYGIFALLAWVSGTYGLKTLIPLMKLVGTVYFGCLLLIFGYYFTVLLLFKVNPLRFVINIADAMITAFSTSSSAATLPTSLRCAEKKLKLNKGISGFLLPLGATLNLNGLSIYITVATIFAANVFGIELHMSQYITIMLTTILAAMGAAAVPGSALIVMTATMTSVGIPLTAMPLIAGVDRFNDMAQTATNVTGDLFAATIISGKADADMPEEKPATTV